MTTNERVTFPNIVRLPGVCGGEPTVRGTRVPVRSIVQLHHVYPDFKRLRRAYLRVTDDQLQEALDYYASHRAEIDQYIRENEDQ